MTKICAVISKSSSYIIFNGIAFPIFYHIKGTGYIELNFITRVFYRNESYQKEETGHNSPRDFFGWIMPCFSHFLFQTEPSTLAEQGFRASSCDRFLFVFTERKRSLLSKRMSYVLSKFIISKRKSYRKSYHTSYRILSFRKESHI